MHRFTPISLFRSRARFMLETIVNLKNNKIKQNNSGNVEVVIRLKKFLGNMNKRWQGKVNGYFRMTVLGVMTLLMTFPISIRYRAIESVTGRYTQC